LSNELIKFVKVLKALSDGMTLIIISINFCIYYFCSTPIKICSYWYDR